MPLPHPDNHTAVALQPVTVEQQEPAKQNVPVVTDEQLLACILTNSCAALHAVVEHFKQLQQQQHELAARMAPEPAGAIGCDSDNTSAEVVEGEDGDGDGDGGVLQPLLPTDSQYMRFMSQQQTSGDCCTRYAAHADSACSKMLSRWAILHALSGMCQCPLYSSCIEWESEVGATPSAVRRLLWASQSSTGFVYGSCLSKYVDVAIVILNVFLFAYAVQQVPGISLLLSPSR